jgi:anti-sigma factor RsiW
LKHEEHLLDLYLDGALDAERRIEISDHLNGCSMCADYVANGEALRTAVQTRLRSVQPPSDLIDSIRTAVASVPAPPPAVRRSRRARPLLSVAAVLALLAIGAILALEVLNLQTSPALELTAELAAAHVRFAHDDSLLEVTGDRSTVLAWFQERVGFQSAAPDVPGYELRGGRIVMFDGHPATMLVYEDESTQEYISILTFATPFGDFSNMERAGAFRVGTIEDLAVAIWSDGDLYHALVGKLPQADVVRLASAASHEP